MRHSRPLENCQGLCGLGTWIKRRWSFLNEQRTYKSGPCDLAPFPEQPNGNEKEAIGKKRATQPRPGARIQRRRLDCQTSRRPERRRSALLATRYLL